VVVNEIKDLKKRGYLVEQLTPYQFRVECILDLYPTRKRFHNIATQERGEYPVNKLNVLTAFIDAHVAKADAILDEAIAAGKEDVSFLSQDGSKTRRRWLGENNPGWWTRYSR